jgi:3-hydroxyacyl-[acyl-carrier-protein] dehydratase
MSTGRIEPEQIHEERGEGRLVRALRVPLDLDCWPGHFPGAEILPGVVQLDWVMQALADWIGRAPIVSEISDLKFKSFVMPGQELTLEIRSEASAGEFRFTLAARDALCTTGRVRLACEPEP